MDNKEKIFDSFKDDDIEEIYTLDRMNQIDDSAEIIDDTAKVILPVPMSERTGVRRVFVVLAVLLLFFSTIGVVNSVNFVYGKVTAIRSQQALKQEIAAFLYPVVINDPPAYDSVDNLLTSTVITSAIWKIILTVDKTGYNTDMGVMFIPAADVESAARSIFGASIFETGALEHQTVMSHGTRFIYSGTDNLYEIPENPTLFSYSPLVTNVTNVGDVYTATVDYIAPSPLQIVGINTETKAVKTMIYTITRTDERMTIDSIKVGFVGHEGD